MAEIDDDVEELRQRMRILENRVQRIPTIWVDILTRTAAFNARFGVWYNCDVSGGAYEATLPAIVKRQKQQAVIIRKIDSSVNFLKIGTTGDDLVNGESTQSLPNQYDTMTLVADGDSGWMIE